MKSIKAIAGVIFLGLVFTGCSVAPQKSASGPVTFTFSQSLWKSVDGGATWKVQNSGTGKAVTSGVAVLSLVVDPADGNHAYAGLASGGIMETKDGGTTWSFINFQSEKVYGLAISPMNGQTLYASGVWQGTGKLFKTTDDGANWQEIYTSPSSGPLIVSLIVDKKNPGTLYATTSDNEVLKSVDAGDSWKDIYNASVPVLKIAEDAGNQNLLYAVTTSGSILRTRDGGATFEDLTTKLSKTTNTYGGSGGAILETDPSVANRVYLAGTLGLLVSNDAGETWTALPTLNKPQTFPVKALAINPQNPREIICGAVQAMYKSTDGGQNWVTSQFDNKMTLRDIEYNLGNPSEIYAGFTK